MYFASTDKNLRKLAYMAYNGTSWSVDDALDSSSIGNIEIVDGGFYIKIPTSNWNSKAYYTAIA